MKTNLKRIFCLLMAAAMLFVVAACGNNSNASMPEFEDEDWNIEGPDTGAGTDGGEEGDATANGGQQQGSSSGSNKGLDALSWSELVSKMPSKLKGTTVRMYSWNPAKHVTGAEKVIADFTKQTGIKVEWTEGSYDNYNSEILALINSGSSPDIIRYQTCNLYRMELTQDAKSATGQDFSGDIWDQELINAFTVNGKIYGVNLKNTFNQQPSAVFYSKATLDRYKLEDPYELWKAGQWTFEKFLELCREFKQQTTRPGWMTNYHLDLLDFYNLDFMTFDGKTFKNNANDPKILSTLQKICSYRETGITCEAMREQDKIENGTYLFTTDNMLCARRTDFHYPKLKEDDDLYCVPFPTTEGQTYYTRMHEYESFGFPKGCKNGEGAYYFLRYYLNRDNYDDKTFFCNSQALETYDYLMKQKRSYKISGGICEVAIGKSNCGLDNWLRTVGKSDQIKSELDAQIPNFERAVKAANETVAKSFK